MADLEQSGVDAETLDRVDICYKVKASFIITLGVYNGVADHELLAQHIGGICDADHIDGVSILEVCVDDSVVARA